jgi:4-hydroxy-3-polyprenylbenzoate decarboxylase
MRPQGTSRSIGNRRRLLADESGERARLVVGIAGASGIIYGVRLLELLAKVKAVETHLIVTPNAKRTLGYELDMSAEELGKLGDVSYRYHDMGAALSSGSFSTSGMIIAPCSVKTLSGIVNCYDDNLLVRAADVTLKERRPLVLLFRETPLHVGHLRMLQHAAEMGAIVMPPVPAFYTRPRTIEEIVDYTVTRALDQLGIRLKAPRWQEQEDPGSAQSLRADLSGTGAYRCGADPCLTGVH